MRPAFVSCVLCATCCDLCSGTPQSGRWAAHASRGRCSRRCRLDLGSLGLRWRSGFGCLVAGVWCLPALRASGIWLLASCLGPLVSCLWCLLSACPAHPDDGDSDDVPIRVLENCAVFNRTTHQFIPVLNLLMNDLSEDWVAAGIVRSVTQDASDSEDEDDTEEAPLVQLSSILEFSVHWVEKNGQSYRLDK